MVTINQDWSISMDKKVLIRKAAPDDYSSLAELAAQLGHQEEPGKLRSRLLSLLGQPDQVIFVAEFEQEIVGWVHGYLYNFLYLDLACELAALVVDQAHRQLGIGRMLVDAIEKWASAQGCHQVSLRSNIKREEAHKFYKAIGYDLRKTQHIFEKDLNK